MKCDTFPLEFIKQDTTSRGYVAIILHQKETIGRISGKKGEVRVKDQKGALGNFVRI